MNKIDLLKEYKELLDSGIITEEEFSAKKKEILETPEGNLSFDSLKKVTKEKADAIKERAAVIDIDLIKEKASEINVDTIKEKTSALKEKSEKTIESWADRQRDDGQSPNAQSGYIPATAVKSEKPKKPIYKKWWFWVIIVILVFGAFGAGGSSDDKAAEDTKVEQTQEADQKEETKTEEKKTEETNKPVEEETSESVELSDDFVVDYLNSSTEWSGKWDAPSEGFYVFYPEGDLADAFDTLTAYYIANGEIPAEIQDSYDSMINSMKSLSSSVESATGKSCSLNIANPSNTDNILLTFMSGNVIYSAFEE